MVLTWAKAYYLPDYAFSIVTASLQENAFGVVTAYKGSITPPLDEYAMIIEYPEMKVALMNKHATYYSARSLFLKDKANLIVATYIPGAAVTYYITNANTGAQTCLNTNKPFREVYPVGDDVSYFHLITNQKGRDNINRRVVSSITDYKTLSGYRTRDAKAVCLKAPDQGYNEPAYLGYEYLYIASVCSNSIVYTKILIEEYQAPTHSHLEYLSNIFGSQAVSIDILSFTRRAQSVGITIFADILTGKIYLQTVYFNIGSSELYLIGQKNSVESLVSLKFVRTDFILYSDFSKDLRLQSGSFSFPN
ncbi:hypothetical protein FGO68_gene9465 [Halteria grandinella]|uniref:Uncharacterized protein n=1 Tax=Halteria grandinella TaxID=5974 RepID=A0A8J8SUQ9_HALGN|nr:hypothetical protein FGO68_gene9465 [Halteria grandinella]